MDKKFEQLKKDFPEGTRVKLIMMDDVQAPESGTCGTVKHVDDMGTIHVSWDTGGSLGVIPEADKVEKMHRIEVTCEVTYRRAFSIEVNDEDYNTILDGDSGPIDDLFENVDMGRNSDYERDYAIYDFDKEKQVVEWDD